MTRVVITGDREWGEDRYGEILSPLMALRLGEPDAFVVLGDARGVDALAREACKKLQLPYVVKEADWRVYGRAAGPMRNRDMLLEGGPDAEVWWFHDDLPRSKGTRNCVEQARQRGMVTRRSGGVIDESERQLRLGGDLGP